MSAGGSCGQTLSQAILATHQGHSATVCSYHWGSQHHPEGTRTIYIQKFLIESHNSPIAKTQGSAHQSWGHQSPPPPMINPNHLLNSHEDKPRSHEELQFEMDI
uniref:Uncharacterized protein n=1 Tax=Sarcophilus harrisii TaxID=9305 RepID=A0A7N4P6L7_SARHA